ncbi:efflux RND transporter permease subunit [Pseudenhygromyxa sp. WMMC2535]|uniref:efflux RND transporter permease subunit n=1 Tax=Pseudenhygromyxa sp. WMMC2535 TaxID=2712867 RepID=UPI0015573E0D|nr:efflux RND transporter permease subunit [Pseudenhygromyxa sp. WMMC2535]NVB41342.1 efflux RND transporter permease subunit [Pseudenhygromyxa sp. WMMC2535]
MFDKIIRLSVNNSVFVNLLFFLIFAAGVVGASKLPREQFPEVSLDAVLVQVTYVGATASDVEELIIRPIEEEIDNVSDIKRVESVASEGSASITVTFNAGTDLRDARAEVEKAVAAVEELPEDAETPQVREVKIDLPVCAVALLGDRSIRLEADRVREALGDLPGVAGVDLVGLTEPRIVVALDEAKLRNLQLTPSEVAAAIANARASVPAGTVESGGAEIFVKTDKRLQSAEDVAAIPLRPGSPLRLGDVAEVRELEEQPDTRYFINGVEAVQMVVKREESADPLEIREDVFAALPELETMVPPGVRAVVSEDYTLLIRDRLRTVLVNGLGGGVLVVLVLAVLAGMRAALLALWGMPVSYLLATFLMDKTDMTLNVISTFGLLIATGIIVDDAIVVIENTQRHLEQGKPRIQAAIDGAKEVLLPVTVAVATTCFAFLPLTMVGGTMGRVMRILPLAVIFCLLGSLIEAIFILPGHLAHYAAKDAEGGRTAKLVERMKAVYRPMLELCLRRRGLVSLLAFVSFVGTIMLAKGMPFQYTAPGKLTELQVTYKLSAGVDREASLAQGEDIRGLVLEGFDQSEEREDGLVRTTKLRIGSVRDPRTQLLETGANTGIIRFEFAIDDEVIERGPQVVAALEAYLRQNPDLAAYQVIMPQAGPPAGPAVTARVRGREPEEIEVTVREIKAFLRGVEGVRDIDDDSGIGKETFAIAVDQDLAALYGLSELEIANAARAAIDGLVATEVSIDEQRVEIVVRTEGAQALDRDGIGSLTVTSSTGAVVRLDQVARLERTRELGSIRRRDSQRTVAVTADVDSEVITALDTTKKIQKFWDERIAPRYPELELQFGGDAEEINESLADLPGAFMLAIGMIYIALALQFRSYFQPVIILCAVPFGIMGAVLGLFGMGYDLSLFALFGVIALAGIVVNDSLVMVDFINSRRSEGATIKDAARDGALERLRPIISTTLTTCFGLGPLAVGLGGKDQILAPMAISIAAGLGISTALVLLVVPAIYVIIERDFPAFFLRIRGKDPALVDAPASGAVVDEDAAQAR